MSFSWALTNLLATFLLPPASGLLAIAGGLALARWRRRAGIAVAVLGLLSLLGFSLHVVAAAMARPLENRHPVWNGRETADAIVILGGGRQRNAPEFGGADEVAKYSLERLRYGAALARQTGLPVMLTAGRPDGGTLSEAEAMQLALQRDFGVKARWIEADSLNTAENAALSARQLQAAGVRRILLVTNAWHMPRSVGVFAAQGFQVVAAPMGFISVRPLVFLDFLPRGESLQESSLVVHEWIGLLWYALRH